MKAFQDIPFGISLFSLQPEALPHIIYTQNRHHYKILYNYYIKRRNNATRSSSLSIPNKYTDRCNHRQLTFVKVTLSVYLYCSLLCTNETAS